MKQIPLLVFVLLLAVPSLLYAQNLVIEKDMLTGKVRYIEIRKNDSIERKQVPLIKKNGKVIIRLINLNPFAYSVNYQFVQQDVKQHFDSTRSLMSYLSGNLESYADLAALLAQPDTSGSRSAKSADGHRSDAEASLGKIISSYNIHMKYLRAFDAAAQSLYSRKDGQAVIETDIRQKIADAFSVQVDEMDKIPEMIAANFSEFSTGYEQLKVDAGLALEEYEKALKASSDEAEQKMLKAKIKSVNDMMKKAEALNKVFSSQESIAKLEMLPFLPYIVRNTSFTFEKEEQMTGDYGDLTLNIVYKRKTLRGSTVPDLDSGIVVTIKERINARGEFVIRSSVGFAFPAFFNQAASYGIKDGKVKGFDDDNFVPNLSTFINFYPFKGRFNNFGGVFGVGYPLTGKEKNMNIMLGVSEALGDKNFVIFNAGVAFGQTHRLGDGWEPGQEVPAEVTEIPTEKKWIAGVFVGITLSLFNR